MKTVKAYARYAQHTCGVMALTVGPHHLTLEATAHRARRLQSRKTFAAETFPTGRQKRLREPFNAPAICLSVDGEKSDAVGLFECVYKTMIYK